MKPHKTAEQRNVAIDTYAYTDERLHEMLRNIKGVFSMYQIDAIDTAYTSERLYLDGAAISLQHVKDLRVELDEYGYYRSVAVMDSGEHIYIVL